MTPQISKTEGDCKLVCVAELAMLLGAFELQFDTAQCVIADVWVWPFIRSLLVSKVLIPKSFSPNSRSKSNKRAAVVIMNRIARKSRLVAKALRGVATECIFSRGAATGHTGKVRVAGLVRASRAREYLGHFIEPIVFPVLSGLASHGLDTEYWGWEKAQFPQPCRERIFEIGRRLEDSACRGHLTGLNWGYQREPRWFTQLHQQVMQELDVRLTWESVAQLWTSINSQEPVFRRILKARKISMLLTDCWYDWPLAAARLAAHREGIPVIELQHGIQEHVHPCFHRWSAVPPRGCVNPFPRTLWVWGAKAASLSESHTLAENVLVGGNMFLNRAVADAERGALANTRSGFNVGYSLTWPLQPLINDLRETILNCPAEWTWVFRTHPSDSKGPLLLRELKAELSDNRLDIESGQRISVVEFLSSVNVHATHDSTCALEALALGMPTLVTLRSAAKTFAPWTQDGVLVEAFDPAEFSLAVETALRVSSSECKRAAAMLFASPETGEESLQRLVRIATRGQHELMRAHQ